MAKYPSQGTVFQVTISAVLTTVANCTEINPPDPEVEIIETTDLTVTHGKTFDTTGLVDAGECGGSLFFDPANATHTFLTGQVKAPVANTLLACKCTYSDVAPTSWTFNAIVKKFTPKVAIGEFLKADFALKVSGVVTGW